MSRIPQIAVTSEVVVKLLQKAKATIKKQYDAEMIVQNRQQTPIPSNKKQQYPTPTANKPGGQTQEQAASDAASHHQKLAEKQKIGSVMQVSTRYLYFFGHF